MRGNARRWKVKGERCWVISPHHTHILPALLWASGLSLPDCSSIWEGWSSTLQLPLPQPPTPSDSISSLCHPVLQVVAAFLLLLSPDLQHPWSLPIPLVPSLRLQSTCSWILSPARSWPKTTFRITLFIVFNSAFCPVNWHFPFSSLLHSTYWLTCYVYLLCSPLTIWDLQSKVADVFVSFTVVSPVLGTLQAVSKYLINEWMNGRTARGAIGKPAVWSTVQAEELTLSFSAPLPSRARNAEFSGRRRKWVR